MPRASVALLPWTDGPRASRIRPHSPSLGRIVRMATQTLDKLVIDGYDLAAEKTRYRFPDVVGRGVTLNRGTAIVKIRGEMENSRYQAARDAHKKIMLLTT